MRGGANIKPTEVKLADGNKGHRPLAPETEPPRIKGGIDRSLVSVAAQAHFDRLRSVLEPRGQWSTDGYLAVLQLAELLASQDALREAIATDGLIVEGKLNPAFRALADADNRIRMWLQEFGLTDAARSRVKIDTPKGKTNDPLAAYGLN